MATIFAADTWGLPVSTTHMLSSGVAGTMAANGSGLQLVDGAEHRGWLGVYAAGRGAALGHAVLPVPSVLPEEPGYGYRKASAAADAFQRLGRGL